MDPAETREAEIARIAESPEVRNKLHEHLQEIVEGTAFKGSHRSGQFLRYIVDQAIAGHFDSLKERVIGVELFGRPPSYDTGEDAIVRVTASDVRKRLLQHYGKYGVASAFHINLPLGSYLPEILFDGAKEDAGAVSSAQPAPQLSGKPMEESPTTAAEAPVDPADSPAEDVQNWPRRTTLWLSLSAAALVVPVIIGIVLWGRTTPGEFAARSVLPWSAFFGSSHDIQLVTSDPNIAEIDFITGHTITLSDYANHNYIPTPNDLTPEQLRLCRDVLRGDKTSSVDVPIAVKIAELAEANGKKIGVRGARDIQLSDLRTDDNFIFLGSPVSDPWAAMFTDQLDFRFVFDPATHSEIIRNIHPRANEKPVYVPSALGWETGDSFAVLALVQNPDQSGHVLLLAGANREGTEAAGKLIVDLPRLKEGLSGCGVKPSGPIKRFEMLLHLNTLAGSPSHIDVLACHVL